VHRPIKTDPLSWSWSFVMIANTIGPCWSRRPAVRSLGKERKCFFRRISLSCPQIMTGGGTADCEKVHRISSIIAASG